MNLRGLNLNLLVALDALLCERSVTRAAARVHISQPGMSAALQKLRVYFSDPLLERSGRSLELTPRAKQLADPLREVLSQLRMIVDPPQATFDAMKAKRYKGEAMVFRAE